jgi:arylsulfatase A-like enzyme
MKPNIIIIISDALRPKDMSLYGYPQENDFYIKKIAAESCVFENNFSASNASDASVTSLFTGKYPDTNGFIHQHPFMREEELEKLKKNTFWLPSYLQKNGYKTMSATPLHLWFKKGFDFFKEKELKGGGKILNMPIIKRMLLNLPNWMYSLGKKISKARASPEFYSCNQVIDTAIDKIKESSRPFFMFMHLVDTHYPYPLVDRQKIDGKSTLKEILKKIDNPKQKEYIKKRFFDINASSMEEIEKRRDLSLKEVDKEIGRLYDFLVNENIIDNTIFIILSDHGDNFGEHNTYFCRGGLYDPSIKTPLIIRIPGIKASRTNELTQNLDIPATILSILGDKKEIDGKSLIDLMKTGKKVRDNVIAFDGFAEDIVMQRTKTKKIIKSNSKPCYLCGAIHNADIEEYDLEEDGEELNNFAKK